MEKLNFPQYALYMKELKKTNWANTLSFCKGQVLKILLWIFMKQNLAVHWEKSLQVTKTCRAAQEVGELLSVEWKNESVIKYLRWYVKPLQLLWGPGSPLASLPEVLPPEAGEAVEDGYGTWVPVFWVLSVFGGLHCCHQCSALSWPSLLNYPQLELGSFPSGWKPPPAMGLGRRGRSGVLSLVAEILTLNDLQGPWCQCLETLGSCVPCVCWT